ncbi:biotin-dependent carboxylase-like uncharacterized protein [Prauserella sediminis]|uniref:Biotin-dependent carboxylase-like uncharacterized protein n=1 Tax=Prauserella sediminis TaxID=577680 RepID=A0A839Y0U9_9PSEU|nr:biotin-dependent carboxyltransferase family protein [Prauserella sediminis]MBB3666313.1 biotin-dependent carboxylase-like uncharacterized protein [Prauserella sediminis]
MPEPAATAPPVAASTAPAVLTVRGPGLSTITDLGRPAGSSIGQMTGGALDQYSAAAANILVGNAATAPLLEVTGLDFSATIDRDLLVSITGATADVTVGGHPQPQWEPVAWPAGRDLRIGRIRAGFRIYIGLHGHVDTLTLLGSCAPDTVLGFGTSLTVGDQITVHGRTPAFDNPWFGAPVFRMGARPDGAADAAPARIPVTDGPDQTEFGTTATRLFTQDFVVGEASNHIGLRLASADSAPLPRRQTTTEMLSRGVPIGAVEVPAGGELLVLHRGRGVTAGYPVLAVATRTGLARLGQVRPGDTVRFVHTTVDEAVRAHQHRCAALQRLSARVAAAFEALPIPTHFT